MPLGSMMMKGRGYYLRVFHSGIALWLNPGHDSSWTPGQKRSWTQVIHEDSRRDSEENSFFWMGNYWLVEVMSDDDR